MTCILYWYPWHPPLSTISRKFSPRSFALACARSICWAWEMIASKQPSKICLKSQPWLTLMAASVKCISSVSPSLSSSSTGSKSSDGFGGG